MATACLPRCPADPASSHLCGGLRLRPHLRSYSGGRRPGQEDDWPQEADGRLERFASRSPPWLHMLGGVRGQSAVDIGEHPHAETYRQEVGTWWTGVADRACPLCPMWPGHAGLLRFK